jgi:hypothetical protein
MQPCVPANEGSGEPPLVSLPSHQGETIETTFLLVFSTELSKELELRFDWKVWGREIQVVISARRRPHQNSTHISLCPREIFSFINRVTGNVAQEHCAAYRAGPDDLGRLGFAFAYCGSQGDSHRTDNHHGPVPTKDRTNIEVLRPLWSWPHEYGPLAQYMSGRISTACGLSSLPISRRTPRPQACPASDRAPARGSCSRAGTGHLSRCRPDAGIRRRCKWRPDSRI